MKKGIVTILLISGMVYAEIDFTRIKGLYTVFRTKQYCSPLFGFAWWNGGQIEKLYRYGNPDDKMVQLIQELFYLNQADGLTFAPTILPNKVGSHITLGAIGVIIQVLDEYLDKKSLHLDQVQHLEKLLEKRLQQEIGFSVLVAASKVEQERVRVLCQPEINNAKKEVERLEKERVVIDQHRDQAEQAVKDFQHEIVKITSQKKALEKKKPLTPELQTQIQHKSEELLIAKAKLGKLQEASEQAITKSKEVKASIGQVTDIERRLENNIKNTVLSENALNKFVILLVGAFEESLSDKPKYFPFTLHNVLLAMVWKKVTTKKDFISYFAKLDHSLFNDNSLLVDNSPAQRAWLQEQYDKKSYQSVVPVLQSIECAPDSNTRVNLLMSNFELLIASWYSYEVFTSIFPPQVLAGWTSYEGNNFADCGSTSLRNALNNLIYMPTTGVLLLSALTAVFKVNDRILHFYSKFGSVEQILEQKTRDAWVQVTSGLTTGTGNQKIDYKSPAVNGVCEIAARSGIRNMNNLIRPLLGINSLSEFNKLPNVQVAEQLGRDPNFGVYTFVINNQYVFKWYFDFRHFFISIDPRYVSTDPAISKFMESIGTLLQKGESVRIAQENNMIMSLVLLYRDRTSLFVPLVMLLTTGDFPHWYRDQVVMALFNASSLNQKIDFIRHLLGNAAVRVDRGNMDILKRLVREIDVEQYYADIVQVILESPVAQDSTYPFHRELDDIVRRGIDIIKDNYPNLMPLIVDVILSHKRDKYYTTLRKNVSFTPAQLIMIIGNKIEPLHDNVREYLQRIKTPLSDEDRSLIREIYKAKIEEFYPMIQKRVDESILNTLKAT